MYVTIESRMSWIMDLIGSELCELFALELAKIAESDSFFFTLASTSVDQLATNIVTIYMTMRSWMSSIMGQIDGNIWSYLTLNKETMFNLTLFTL